MVKKIDKVWVVAWEYDGGGGFDWYYTQEAAKKARRAEQRNEREFRNERWKAILFEYNPRARKPESITREIDYYICENSFKEIEDKWCNP